ncbi:hypothetical protein M0657_008968 [Pyricularia oryzae]|nr:hypothetical protein M0657_008968 [Pyricularia oryzae]KAI7916717.1 hypothetical protein M9X92_007766 [Pyricularia oryzae]
MFTEHSFPKAHVRIELYRTQIQAVKSCREASIPSEAQALNLDQSNHPCQAGNIWLSHTKKSFVQQTNSALDTTNPTKVPPQQSARTAFSFNPLGQDSLG